MWTPRSQAIYDKYNAQFARYQWNIPKQYIAFKEPPVEAFVGDRYWGFGWVIPDFEGWIEDFGLQKNGHASWSAGMRALMVLAKTREVYQFPTPYEPNETRLKYPDGEEHMCKWMIAIAFTRSLYRYLRRPSAEGYARLAEVLPGEPRWYPDFYEKKDWGRHVISVNPECFRHK